MVLNPLFLGGVWFIIHRYSVFHTFIWRGWVGGLSQMKLTSFEKNCHILRRSLREHAMVFLNPNASQDEIVKSGEEVIASLYGSITYEGLDLLICRIFTRKVSASPYLAPTSAASSYHDKRAYLQLQEKIWTEN